MPDPDPRIKKLFKKKSELEPEEAMKRCTIANPIVCNDDYYIVLLTNDEYNGLQRFKTIDKARFWDSVNTKPLSF
jgi:hypothetical protein